MFRKLLMGLAAWAFAATVPAAAQSVSDLYASNCRTAEQRASEGCRTLAASLPPAEEPASATEDLFYYNAVYRDAGNSQTYFFVRSRDGDIWLTSLQKGFIARITTPGGVLARPEERGPTRLGDGSLLIGDASQAHLLIAPPPEPGGTSPRITLVSKDGRRDFLPLKVADAALFNDKLLTAITAEGILKNWGPYARLAGSNWRRDFAGLTGLTRYTWRIAGVVMEVETVSYQKDELYVGPTIETMWYDPETGFVTSGGNLKGKADSATIFRYEPRPYEKKAVASRVKLLGPDSFEAVGYQIKNGKESGFGPTVRYYRKGGDTLADARADYLGQRRAAKSSGGGGFMGAVTGAIMGAATGYAESGGSSVGAIVGGMGGAAVGSAGGNDALYQQMEETRARVTYEAEESQYQLQQTIARAERQAAAERAAAASQQAGQGSGGQSHGERVVAQEQARAEQLRQEREARTAEEQRLAQQEAAAKTQREAEARRLAEAERNRPVEWTEGVVLCEPRQNSQEWRCTGPLQMNILKLDAPNTMVQLGLACGSSDGIREIGPTGNYRAFGCGFGIHPTAKTYPGNRDVPADFGVFVSDRRVFHCPATKDAYCRTP